MIPEIKQPAVTRALYEAFGVSDYEEIQPISGGQSSALVFRVVVEGRPYLLKTLREEKISDPANEFASMQVAAEAGVAPRVWYANVEDRVLITDFVEARHYPDDMARRMALILRTLHALPGFSKPAMGSYFDAMDGFVRRFKAAKLLPESATDELFRGYAEVVKVYPRSHSELVASHNDLKPQNMVFDGECLWLVDWESAFLNDPYVDLAVVANFFVKDEAEEERYLDAYFGEPASPYQSARFYLMRQAIHMFYAGLLMSLAARAGLPMETDMTAPDFHDYHRRLISGEIDTLQPEAQVQYAKVHMNQAIQNMRAKRFAEAVAKVSDAPVTA
jgi:thiamine kinase-like enzyme